jgi:hypothetical protein
VTGDDLRQRFEALEAEVLPLAGSPAAETARRRGRRRQRAIRFAGLLAAVLLVAGVARGAEQWGSRPGVGPVAPVPTTRPAVAPSTTTPPASSVAPSTTAQRPPTTTRPATGTAARAGILGVDRLGTTTFGTGEGDALDQLGRRLGAPDERRSWRTASTPFGLCPGPVRIARWGRLYVLFTNGPTRYAPGGGWHLFAYQVDVVQRSVVDPSYTGPTPPELPPLRGYSPRTAAGIGFGSTLAELRRAYGGRVDVSFGEPGNAYRFRVGFGATGELSGSLSGGTPAATVTVLAAGAGCGE